MSQYIFTHEHTLVLEKLLFKSNLLELQVHVDKSTLLQSLLALSN